MKNFHGSRNDTHSSNARGFFGARPAHYGGRRHASQESFGYGEAKSQKTAVRPVVIDDVEYTYRDRTDPRFSMYDAECIAASLARDQGLALRNPGGCYTTTSRGVALTTVELNREVARLMATASRIWN